MLEDLIFYFGAKLVLGFLDEEKPFSSQHRIDHSLISLGLLRSHVAGCTPQVSYDALQVLELGADICLRDQKRGCFQDIIFVGFPVFKSVNEVVNSLFEVLSSPSEIVLLEGEHELHFRSLAKGPIDKIAV